MPATASSEELQAFDASGAVREEVEGTCSIADFLIQLHSEIQKI
jgi:hypothetical protein